MPEKEFVERSRPLSSTYKQDFMPNQVKPQLFTQRPKTSFDGVPTTSYRYSHGSGAPNRTVINAMNNEALKLSLLNRKERAMSAAVYRGRESVASCLTWSSAKPKPNQQDTVRPLIPLATQTTEFVPHPPSAPKTHSPTHAMQEAWPAPTAEPPMQTQAPPTQQMAPVTQQVITAPPAQQSQPMAE